MAALAARQMAPGELLAKYCYLPTSLKHIHVARITLPLIRATIIAVATKY